MKKIFTSLNLILLLVLLSTIAGAPTTYLSPSSDIPNLTDQIEDIDEINIPLLSKVLSLNPQAFISDIHELIVYSNPTPSFLSKVSQLLCSHRIALPPPTND